MSVFPRPADTWAIVRCWDSIRPPNRFQDQNEAFVAKQLSHSFPTCPKEFLIIYMYVHEFFNSFYVFHKFTFFFF